MTLNNFFSNIKKLAGIKKFWQYFEREKQSPDEIHEMQVSEDDISKTKQFLIKYGPYLLIIIPILITIFVRYQSIGLTIADDWAADNVYIYYESQIKNQIAQQYPNLEKAKSEELVANQFIKFIKENKNVVDGQIKSASQQYKDFFQYESGAHSYPYMGDIDSYYWLRQAKNIVEKGYNCDVIENGKCYDTYTLAPGKVILPKSLHPYAIAFFYKLLKPFNKDLTLMQVQLIVPTIFASIIAISTYLIMLRLSGTLAAITSSVLISVNPLFLSRSIGSDNDIYNILFPILIVFIAFKLFNANDLKAKVVLSAILGLSIGAYSFAWIGWWYLFDFILVSILLDYGIFAAKEVYKSKKIIASELLKSQKTKDMLAVLLPFFIVAVITVAMFSGINSLNVAYSGFLSFTKSKVAANSDIWPNVLTTVAEFNAASIPEIIQHSWSKWFFFFAILGFIILVYKTLKTMIKSWMLSIPSILILYYLVTPNALELMPVRYIMVFSIPFLIALYFVFKSEERVDIRFPVLFFLWTAASIYAATKGVRFTLLLVPPIAIGIGITFGFFHRSGATILASLTKINKVWFSIILFLVLSSFLIKPVEAGISTAKNYLPNVNDNWWNALTKIKENSKPDAIINSWWDFGHWFKYIADRRVTLDGSSQNHPQLHWLGKLLLTSNEKEAVGILKMIDCGGNLAFDYINKEKSDTPKAMHTLNRVILVEKGEAKNILVNEGFSEEVSEKILSYTHCEPPEDFLIASEDMVGKGGVWAHFGSWNFDKAWMHKTFDTNKGEDKVIKMFMNEFNYSRETATGYYSEIKELSSDSDINSWIAPWPSYMGQTSCQNQGNLIICPFQQGSIGVNLTSMEAYIPTAEGIKRPAMFSYTTSTGINVKGGHNNTIGIGVVLLVSKDGSYNSIFMSPQLVNSTFTKLFYLDGHGTSYFDLFHENTGNNLDIKVWKVNWKGSDKPRIVEKFA